MGHQVPIRGGSKRLGRKRPGRKLCQKFVVRQVVHQCLVGQAQKLALAGYFALKLIYPDCAQLALRIRLRGIQSRSFVA